MDIENVSRECIIIKVGNKNSETFYLKNGFKVSTHFSGVISIVLNVYSLSGLYSIKILLSFTHALQVLSNGIFPFSIEFFGL